MRTLKEVIDAAYDLAAAVDPTFWFVPLPLAALIIIVASVLFQEIVRRRPKTPQ